MRYGNRSSITERGVSLIEALVALAVMAFGMLAIVGVQSTLRFNSDIAKQRSEAVRIAGQAIDDARSFAGVVSVAGTFDYTDILTATDAVTGYTSNAAYTITRTVTSLGDVDSSDDPRMKTLRVSVNWTDRLGNAGSTVTPDRVELNTVIARVMPELAGSLSLAANVTAAGLPIRGAMQRNPVIPVRAIGFSNGTSGFRPPQSAGGTVAWVFNNTTGVITVCQSSATSTALLTLENITGCASSTAQLVSGFIRFAYSVQPTAAVAEAPTDTALNLDVSVSLSSAGNPAPGWTCYDDAPASAALATSVRVVNYYCAVYSNSSGLWSGVTSVVPVGFDAGLAWTIPSALPGSGYAICRYTPTSSDTPANIQHPRSYLNVSVNDRLSNQNFLVISAAYSCPTDTLADPATGDFINSNTRQHQPAP